MAVSSGIPLPSGSEPQTALLFRTGPLDLALPIADVREVLACPELTQGPVQPRFIAGFFSLDGQVALVLRLDRVLGLPDSPEDLYAPLLHLAGPGPARLLLVDRADAVVPVTNAVTAAPGESFNGCVIARFEHAGRLVHLLDRDALLLTAEEAATRSFVETSTARLDALIETAQAGDAEVS